MVLVLVLSPILSLAVEDDPVDRPWRTRADTGLWGEGLQGFSEYINYHTTISETGIKRSLEKIEAIRENIERQKEQLNNAGMAVPGIIQVIEELEEQERIARLNLAASVDRVLENLHENPELAEELHPWIETAVSNNVQRAEEAGIVLDEDAALANEALSQSIELDRQKSESRGEQGPSYKYQCGISWGGINLKICIVEGFAVMVSLWLYILSWLVYLAGQIMNFALWASVANFKSYADMEVIKEGWRLFRDLANICFIFALLYIAISTILGLNQSQNKKMLAMIIIVALLVNFSAMFTRLGIDVSNIITITFYNNIGGRREGDKYPDVSTAFVQGLNPNKVVGAADNDTGFRPGEGGAQSPDIYVDTMTNEKAELEWLKIITSGLGLSLLMIITTFVLLAAAILFLIRLIVLLFLIILSPLAFLGWAIPKIKASITNTWLKALTDQLIFAPAFMILFYISFKMLEAVQNGLPTGESGGSVAVAGIAQGVEDWMQSLMTFVIIIGFMIASLIVAKQTGAKGFGAATGIAAAGTGLGLAAIKKGGQIGYGASKFTAKKAGGGTAKYIGQTKSFKAIQETKAGKWVGQTAKDTKKRADELTQKTKESSAAKWINKKRQDMADKKVGDFRVGNLAKNPMTAVLAGVGTAAGISVLGKNKEKEILSKSRQEQEREKTKEEKDKKQDEKDKKEKASKEKTKKVEKEIKTIIEKPEDTIDDNDRRVIKESLSSLTVKERAGLDAKVLSSEEVAKNLQARDLEAIQKAEVQFSDDQLSKLTGAIQGGGNQNAKDYIESSPARGFFNVNIEQAQSNREASAPEPQTAGRAPEPQVIITDSRGNPQSNTPSPEVNPSNQDQTNEPQTRSNPGQPRPKEEPNEYGE